VTRRGWLSQGRSRGLAACAIACLLSLSASAAPLPVTLIWVAPPECPQYDEVWAQLSSRLGRSPSTPEGSAFAARVNVRQEEDATWRLSVETLSSAGAGRRELTGNSCQEVTHTAVVALSLAIDPTMEAPAKAPARALWLGLGAQSSLGLLPMPTAGLSLAATADLGLVSLQVGVSAALAQRLAVDQVKGLRLAQPIAGAVSGCLAQRWSRVALLGCLEVRGGVVSGIGEGVDQPALAFAGFFGVGPGVQLQGQLTSWFSLRAGVEGDLALVRPAFKFATGPVVFSSSLFSLSGYLGVELRVW
jgi:hypothetical protein